MSLLGRLRRNKMSSAAKAGVRLAYQPSLEKERRVRHDSALINKGFIDRQTIERMSPKQREEYYYNIKERVLQRVPPEGRKLAGRMSLEDLLKYQERARAREGGEFSNIESRIIRSSTNPRATEKHARELEKTGFKVKGLSPQRINRVYYEEKNAFVDAMIREGKMPEGVREGLMQYDLKTLREDFLKSKQRGKKKIQKKKERGEKGEIGPEDLFDFDALFED